MANENRIQAGKTPNNKTDATQTVEVLYQKLGDRWYAFSLVDDEVFVGSLTDDQIQGEKSPKISAHS